MQGTNALELRAVKNRKKTEAGRYSRGRKLPRCPHSCISTFQSDLVSPEKKNGLLRQVSSCKELLIRFESRATCGRDGGRVRSAGGHFT